MEFVNPESWKPSLTLGEAGTLLSWQVLCELSYSILRQQLFLIFPFTGKVISPPPPFFPLWAGLHFSSLEVFYNQSKEKICGCWICKELKRERLEERFVQVSEQVFTSGRNRRALDILQEKLNEAQKRKLPSLLGCWDECEWASFGAHFSLVLIWSHFHYLAHLHSFTVLP